MKQHLQFSRPIRCLPNRHRFFGEIELRRRAFWRVVAVPPSADPLERVAECEQAIDATADSNQREMLTHLRTLWVNLARESPLLDGAAVQDQVATLTRIHVDLMRAAITGAVPN
jgi:hypothetical protein